MLTARPSGSTVRDSLAVLAVLDLGAAAGRVDDRAQPAAGGVLVAPDAAVGVLPRLQRADAVVAVGGAVAERGDRGDDAAQRVALETGDVAFGVGAGDQVAALVVLEPQGDALGVDDLA